MAKIVGGRRCRPPKAAAENHLNAVLRIRIRIRIRKDPKLLPSRIRIRIRIRIQNKLISRIRIRIRIRNYRWGSGLLKKKCSDKNTIFNIKSSISAQKLPLNVHYDFKCENFKEISRKFQSRIRIRIRKDPRAGSGSGSEMTLFLLGSGSEMTLFLFLWKGQI